MIKFEKHFQYILVLLLLTGCSQGMRGTNSDYFVKQMAKNSKKPRVIIQVCSPSSEITPVFSIEKITRYSLGKGGYQPVFKTNLGQTVAEKSTALFSELIAISVNFRGEEIKSIFIPPSGLKRTKWTRWYKPNFQSEQNDIGYRLLRNHSYVKKQPEKNAPRIRYILKSHTEYIEEIKKRKNRKISETIPSC